jgi:hypothetical protein
MPGQVRRALVFVASSMVIGASVMTVRAREVRAHAATKRAALETTSSSSSPEVRTVPRSL